jgi:hypothetical protein
MDDNFNVHSVDGSGYFTVLNYMWLYFIIYDNIFYVFKYYILIFKLL